MLFCPSCKTSFTAHIDNRGKCCYYCSGVLLEKEEVIEAPPIVPDPVIVIGDVVDQAIDLCVECGETPCACNDEVWATWEAAYGWNYSFGGDGARPRQLLTRNKAYELLHSEAWNSPEKMSVRRYKEHNSE